MKNRNGSWVIIFFLLFNIFTSMFITTPTTDTAVAQTFENSYGKLEVWPDTSTNMVRQLQYWNLTSYYTGCIDIAFAFDIQLDYGGIYYWDGDSYNKLSMNHVEYNNRHYYVYNNFNVVDDGFYHGYWEYDAIGSGKWDMYVKRCIDTWSDYSIHLDPYWDSEWSYGVTWHINMHNYISEDLHNFPFLFNISTSVTSACQADGGDLRFLIDDNDTANLLNYQIENLSTTDESIVWVNLTNVSSTSETIVNMYYGNIGAPDGWNNQSVWDTNYKFVSHMNGSNAVYDSTSNINNAIGYANQSDGKIGYCQDFEPDSDGYEYMRLNSKVTPLTSMTLEAWINPEGDNTEHGIINSLYNTDYWEYMEFRWYRLSTNNIHFDISDDNEVGNPFVQNDTNTSMLSTDGWYYVTASYDAFNSAQFLNTTQDGTTTGEGTMSDYENAATVIGARTQTSTTYTWEFDGLIDEVRISQIARNLSWLNACFHTMNMTIGLLNMDGVQDAPSFKPSNFTATTESDGDILLKWINSENATDCYIEYNTSSSWERGDGTLLYNGTGTSYTHTSLSCNQIYYYQAWGFNDSTHNFSSIVETNNISCPGNPTSVTATIDGTNLLFTWTTGNYTDNTLIIRKTGSYPTSHTDGTEIYNNNGETHTDSNVLDTYYYTLYSYNSTTGRYSTGQQRAWGGLSINVYDENTSLPIYYWDVFISNSDGTSTYENLSNNNTLTIDIADLPYGDDCIIIINKTNATENYTSKIFIMDLELNTNYQLDVYLAEDTSTEQYVITVVGPQTEYGYEPPIEDATVQFKRYINASVGYQNVSILKTSASGTVTIDLIPLQKYLVIVSKTGYNTEYVILTPVEIVYTEDRYHKIRLTEETSTTVTIDEFYEDIIFIGSMNGPGYLIDGNISITYTDSNSSTTNTDIYLFEHYNGTITLLNNYHNTSNSFTLNFPNINTTRIHTAMLYFNTTATYEILKPVNITIYNIYIVDTQTGLDLDDRITNIIGPFEIGDYVVPYTDIIAIILPLIILMSFGVYNTGVGIIGCGLSMGLVQGIYGMYEGVDINAALILMCPLIIVIGVMYIWTKKPGVDSL